MRRKVQGGINYILTRPVVNLVAFLGWLSVLMIGPFQTFPGDLADRAMHSLVWVGALYLTSWRLSAPLYMVAVERGWPMVAVPSAIVIGTIPAATALHAMIFDFEGVSASSYAALAFGLTLLTLAPILLITMAYLPRLQTMFEDEGYIASILSFAGSTLDPINGQIPPEKRGTVLSLMVEGKYVAVVTTRGKHLIRASLSSLEALVDAEAGLRVHRSTWVRRDQIRRLNYVNGNPVIELTDARVLPISRSALPKIRAHLSKMEPVG